MSKLIALAVLAMGVYNLINDASLISSVGLIVIGIALCLATFNNGK